jgi:hypothetical protein
MIYFILLLRTVEAAERMKKLPDTVQIELRPRNGEAFAKVQSLAQNPRIKVNISIQRRLSSLIRMLERKWRPLNLKRVSWQYYGFTFCQ